MNPKFDEVISDYLKEAPQEPAAPQQPPMSDADQAESPAPGTDMGDLPPPEGTEKKENELPEGLATSIALSMIRAMKWIRNNIKTAEAEDLLAQDIPTNDQEALNFLEKVDSFTSREIKPAYPNEYHGPAVKNT